MTSKIPKSLNPHTRKKFEAIGSYDPYENVISELNNSFHHSYNLLIHKKVEALGQAETPVIVLESDTAILLWNGKKESVAIIPDLYHKVKSIGHVSFGLYITLQNNGIGTISKELSADLAHQKELIEKALDILNEENIPAYFMAIHRKILKNANNIISEVLDKGKISNSWAEIFAHENSPLFLEGAKLGVALELDVLDDVVMNWKSQMSSAQWDALFVVICSGHQSRYRNASLQYFDMILKQEEGAGARMEDRIVYGENIHGLDAAIDILARHLMDQQSSLDLFGSKTKLQEDLMADAAEAYLKKKYKE